MSRADALTIVSGGQTGVDRAALDAALATGVPVGGWCPQGRLAEDGVIPTRYPLRETPTPVYPVRTEWNVRDSDGTLILAHEPLNGGTLATLELAVDKYHRPVIVADPAEKSSVERVLDWLEANEIRVLNVAGPRESAAPGIHGQAYTFLSALLTHLAIVA